ncbi:hypothetical protein llg_28690 [Luteolibacter sp. LG18]|nr:hypothetical protein llg_28690 [Luteolibacter sp. LG18]
MLALAAVGYALLRPPLPTPRGKAPEPPVATVPPQPANATAPGTPSAESDELSRLIDGARIAADQTATRKAAEEAAAKDAQARALADEMSAKAAKLLEETTPAPVSEPPAITPPVAAKVPEISEPEGLAVSGSSRGSFVHPGLLHNEEDFKRMRTYKGVQPWRSGWEKMTNSRHANLDWKPRPADIVVRGGTGENYADFYRDIATAYVCAVNWRVTGKKAYAEKSIEILNAWSSTLKSFGGNYDRNLAAGIYGFEIANAAEIMRTYSGWKPEDFKRFQKMMLTIFYPINKHFVETHGDSPGKIDHFWPNWELCNLASLVAIGVVCDERKIYNEAIRYMKTGDGNGAIKVAVYHIHPDGLGQWVESARDQGHTLMGIGLMAAICEMAWKQGDDLYGYDNNRFLAACEYVAKYNLGEEVPFKKYVNSVQGTFTEVGGGGRGMARPVWELPYNHYVKRKGLSAPWLTKMVEKSSPEGGVGDYGPNSGGYDTLGFGTFTATLDNKAPAKPPRR